MRKMSCPFGRPFSSNKTTDFYFFKFFSITNCCKKQNFRTVVEMSPGAATAKKGDNMMINFMLGGVSGGIRNG